MNGNCLFYTNWIHSQIVFVKDIIKHNRIIHSAGIYHKCTDENISKSNIYEDVPLNRRLYSFLIN